MKNCTNKEVGKWSKMDQNQKGFKRRESSRFTGTETKKFTAVMKKYRINDKVNLVTYGDNEFSDVIIVDSERSENVIHAKTHFRTMKEIEPMEFGLASVQTAAARYKGWTIVRLGRWTNLNIENVYYIPNLKLNLMSGHYPNRSGITTTISRNIVSFTTE